MIFLTTTLDLHFLKQGLEIQATYINFKIFTGILVTIFFFSFIIFILF